MELSPAILSAQNLKIFEALPDAYLLLSPELIIITASDAFLASVGRVRQEMIGQRLTDAFTAAAGTNEGETMQRLLQSLRLVLATGQPNQMAIQRYDLGTLAGEKAVSYRSPLNTPVFDEQGRLSYIIHKADHITAHKKTELEVLEQKLLVEAFDKIFTSGIQVFKSIRNIDNEIVDFEWLYASPQTEDFLGKGPVKGHRLTEKFPASRSNGLLYQYCKVAETGEPVKQETRHKGEHAEHWFEVNLIKHYDGIIATAEDITERKNAEAELKQSKELLQSIYDTSIVGMAVHQAVRDENGTIIDFRIKVVNKELEKLTGRTDLPGKLYAQEFPGIKQTGLFDTMVQVTKTGKPDQLEYSYPHDGFQKWFLSMFVKVNDGLVATNLDITARKQAEEERVKNFLLLEQAEDLAEMGSWQYNPDTGALTWSDGMYRLFNLAKGTEVHPDVYLQYVTPRSRLAAERIVSHIKTGEQGFDEVIEIAVDNEIKTLKMKGRIVHDVPNQAAGVLGVDLDITATRLAEKKLLENAAMIKGIADAAPDMLYVIDIQTMQKVYANYKIVQLLHKTLEEMKAMGPALFDQCIHPDDIEKFKANLEDLRHTQGDEVKEVTYRLIDYKGEQHWVKSRRTVFKRDDTGTPVQILGISQDITEQLELQERNRQLRQERKELEDRRQQEILHTTLNAQEEERHRIAESLHNGLGQILYGVKLSLSHIDLNISKKQKENTEVLKHTEKLLSDAIKESRRISHELSPTILEDFGLKTALGDIFRQLGLSAGFKYVFTGALNKLDKYLQIVLYRSIQELLLNIVKHAGATEGLLKVAVSKNYISIEVSDNGKGFDTLNIQDTGIGLNTIQNKIKLLKGSMNIVSSPNSGTTITIRIPNKGLVNHP